MKTAKLEQEIPAQHQEKHPGMEYKMDPEPVYKRTKTNYRLKDKVAIITGGDSGIGRAVAIAFAQEAAKVVVVYLDEDKDAKLTKTEVKNAGSECLLIAGDIKKPEFCKKVVEQTINKFGKLDILVNNAGVQYFREDLEEIETKDLKQIFETNVYSFFYFIKFALPHLKKGSSIINTSSVTAYRGSKSLVDYAATKGAIIALTRSLSGRLVDKGIRVNAVAPGPIWTPFIPSTFPKDDVENFGDFVPMGRAGQPVEVAPAFVFLASEDSSYITGQVIHPNGGEIVGA